MNDCCNINVSVPFNYIILKQYNLLSYQANCSTCTMFQSCQQLFVDLLQECYCTMFQSCQQLFVNLLQKCHLYHVSVVPAAVCRPVTKVPPVPCFSRASSCLSTCYKSATCAMFQSCQQLFVDLLQECHLYHVSVLPAAVCRPVTKVPPVPCFSRASSCLSTCYKSATCAMFQSCQQLFVDLLQECHLYHVSVVPAAVCRPVTRVPPVPCFSRASSCLSTCYKSATCTMFQSCQQLFVDLLQKCHLCHVSVVPAAVCRPVTRVLPVPCFSRASSCLSTCYKSATCAMFQSCQQLFVDLLQECYLYHVSVVPAAVCRPVTRVLPVPCFSRASSCLSTCYKSATCCCSVPGCEATGPTAMCSSAQRRSIPRVGRRCLFSAFFPSLSGRVWLWSSTLMSGWCSLPCCAVVSTSRLHSPVSFTVLHLSPLSLYTSLGISCVYCLRSPLTSAY